MAHDPKFPKQAIGPFSFEALPCFCATAMAEPPGGPDFENVPKKFGVGT